MRVVTGFPAQLLTSMSYKYDLAISFAGAQRELAQQLAVRLDAAGYCIFYDEFFQGELWGRDLSVALEDVYARDARYCLILLSQDYLERPWTVHERRHAISRFISQRGEYVLCLKIDSVDLPGLPSSISYLPMRKFSEDDVYKLLLEKLGRPDHEGQLSALKPEDVAFAQKIIEACFRRAIYTRMDSEINLPAMYASIGKAIAELQRISPRVHDQRLQFVCLQIISALDEVERFARTSGAHISNSLSPEERRVIDSHKLQVVRALLEIRRAACIPMQLPFSLRVDHFFRHEDAEAKPQLIAA
jgi:hypothetical protein